MKTTPSVRSLAGLALLVLGGLSAGVSCPDLRADYEGLFVSAVPQSPVALGQPLRITVTLQNSGTFPWLSFELPAWLVQVDNPSWAASWAFLNDASFTDVDADETVITMLTLDPSELPAAPGSYSIRLSAAFNAYDLDLLLMDGSPKTVNFTIQSGNQRPVLDPIEDHIAVTAHRLSFQVRATDPDVPAQSLSFELEAGAPSGASIDGSTGNFTWTPPTNHSPQINPITVLVTDDGSPPLSATGSFNVIVIDPPRLEPLVQPRNEVLTLRWSSYPGLSYRLQYKDDVGSNDWLDAGNNIVAGGTSISTTNNVQGASRRFYQVLLVE